MIYIIPAIIGGFVIALLFKYRKKFTLQAFFGTAIFFATAFISYFFFEVIIYVLQLKSFGMILGESAQSLNALSQPYTVYYPVVRYIIIPISLAIAVAISFVISSRRFLIYSKNYALLFLGGLMGAFLAVILPTWTVVFMLVGLSVYDIYSVRHGPIREIMELTYGPADTPPPAGSKTAKKPIKKSKKVKKKLKKSGSAIGPDAGNAQTLPEPKIISKIDETGMPARPAVSYSAGQNDDDLLSNMTYGTKHWDLGIGDLVFYSMLGSHSLMFGTQYISKFGFIAPIALFIATTIGIIMGFMITLRLLKRNAMLPGLPMSIFLGLIGFGVCVSIFHFI
jgi:hypothetical protein